MDEPVLQVDVNHKKTKETFHENVTNQAGPCASGFGSSTSVRLSTSGVFAKRDARWHATKRSDGERAERINAGIQDHASYRTDAREGLTRKYVSCQRHKREWETSLRCHSKTHSRHARHARDEYGGHESFPSCRLEWLGLFGQGECSISRAVERDCASAEAGSRGCIEKDTVGSEVARRRYGCVNLVQLASHISGAVWA